MKKILWIPQLATIDKKTGKTIINADSNITILNGIVDNLTDYEFYVVMPDESYCNCEYSEALSSKVSKILISNNSPINAFALRYDFDFREMLDWLTTYKFDFIVNNTSTLTKNIQAAMYCAKSFAYLINFLHFLDLPKEDKVPKEVSYFIRQIEGVLSADLAVFQSYTVRDKTLSAIDEFLGPKNVNACVWNATYSQTEIDEYKYDLPRKKWIVFPNRLSSTNYSNHLRFFEAIRNLERNDFEIIVNNPTQYMTYDEIARICPNLKILNDGKLLNKEQYLEMLNKAYIGVALFTQEGHGGVSSKQFQAAGCLPVFPQVNEYQYLMPSTYKGFVKSDLSNLEDALNYVLDIYGTDEEYEMRKIAKDLIYKRDSFEYNIQVIKDSLESL